MCRHSQDLAPGQNQRARSKPCGLKLLVLVVVVAVGGEAGHQKIALVVAAVAVVTGRLPGLMQQRWGRRWLSRSALPVQVVQRQPLTVPTVMRAARAVAHHSEQGCWHTEGAAVQVVWSPQPPVVEAAARQPQALAQRRHGVLHLVGHRPVIPLIGRAGQVVPEAVEPIQAVAVALEAFQPTRVAVVVLVPGSI